MLQDSGWGGTGTEVADEQWNDTGIIERAYICIFALIHT